MTELIEAVARAICHDEWTTPGTDLKPEAVARVVDHEWEHWSSVAQAALTAITDAGYRIVKDEPAQWQRRRKFALSSDAPGTIPMWNGCSSTEATGHFEKMAGYEYRALYAAPGDET